MTTYSSSTQSSPLNPSPFWTFSWQWSKCFASEAHRFSLQSSRITGWSYTDSVVSTFHSPKTVSDASKSTWTLLTSSGSSASSSSCFSTASSGFSSTSLWTVETKDEKKEAMALIVCCGGLLRGWRWRVQSKRRANGLFRNRVGISFRLRISADQGNGDALKRQGLSNTIKCAHRGCVYRRIRSILACRDPIFRVWE